MNDLKNIMVRIDTLIKCVAFRGLLAAYIVTVNPLSPHDALASFYIPEYRLYFPTTRGFKKKISK